MNNATRKEKGMKKRLLALIVAIVVIAASLAA